MPSNKSNDIRQIIITPNDIHSSPAHITHQINVIHRAQTRDSLMEMLTKTPLN